MKEKRGKSDINNEGASVVHEASEAKKKLISKKQSSSPRCGTMNEREEKRSSAEGRKKGGPQPLVPRMQGARPGE